MAETTKEWPDDIKQHPAHTKCCKNCRNFCPYIYEFDTNEPDNRLVSDYGECRRFPPKPVPSEESGFPVVHEDCWCGEFDF